MMLGMYLLGVVYLVRRQMIQLEKEEEDMIVMIDKQGKTDIKTLGKLLNDANEVFTWKSASQNSKEIDDRNSTKLPLISSLF